MTKQPRSSDPFVIRSDPFVIRAVRHEDLDQVIRILNREITGGVNIFRLIPFDDAAAQRWWALHGAGRYQAIVATPSQRESAVDDPTDIDSGRKEASQIVLGWAAVVPHSAYEGYDRTAEVSIWVDERFRGQGVGKALLLHLLASCPERNLRSLISRIESNNVASLRLHEACGFVQTGLLRDIGEKFGQSLHVAFLQYWVPDALPAQAKNPVHR